MFFSANKKEEEEIAEVEEDSCSEESEDEEEVSPPLNFDKEDKESRLDFHQRCRDIFIEEWLKADGNWIESLKPEHLAFLRDILNIPSSTVSWFAK